ncbi:2Fe-2S iron-sulfur cluster binding domain-containing protein [Methylovulum psychrotolerans]|uniref:2Fe-2S iron-sulfur cluster-binding protein n=1 Tax=Methylovulum psychrotolerans TaxID=1704499 RepID=UPI001BFEF3F4|nr:2Fe-2S iron-sulfur cluster-binding protein [Methylovulum psychrotolerans]MBT9097256.1 2Fe-2S iron-sulfur cluster binding domain-containing protein [Methylovulum psychrotolerans]
MPHITLGASQLTCPSETLLLDSLLQANLRIPYSCRQGICQSCLMQSLDAKPPALAQVGLKDTLQRQNYFLACRCYPEQDMHITLPNQHGQSINAVVTEKRRLAPDIMQLTVQANGLNFYAGQFINLQRADGLTRSYSIANPPSPDNTLEFHIRRLPHGQFSNWVHDGLAIGDPLTLSQAQGSCYYLPDNPAQPLLLIGTGSGLAPLYGIIHDALAQGHSGDIHLYHGSRDPDGLYLTEELHTLAANVAHFHYTPCLSGEPQASGYAQGRAHELALADKKNLKGWRVYLCGHPEMVNNSQRMAYIKGASLKDIYSDAFVVQPSPEPDRV